MHHIQLACYPPPEKGHPMTETLRFFKNLETGTVILVEAAAEGTVVDRRPDEVTKNDANEQRQDANKAKLWILFNGSALTMHVV